MDEKIKHLAYCRKVETEYKCEILEIENELAETPLGQRIVRARKLLEIARADVTDAVEVVQTKALRLYAKTGNKTPHPDAKIALTTVLAYEPDQAHTYARLHLPRALKLDRRTFEKAAKVLDLNFVTITQKPRVRISRDLSAHLGEPA